MSFFENAQDVLEQGGMLARDAVSSLGVTRLGFVQGFMRLCDDGWDQGWHERNGGNLTYRMTADEAIDARAFFNKEPGPWVPMGVHDESLAGSFFLTTGSGRYMRNVIEDPPTTSALSRSTKQAIPGASCGALPTAASPPPNSPRTS